MNHMLAFSNLVMNFDAGKQPLKVSGFVDDGEVLAVTGPSGAGKSTLLRILCRLIAPAEGTMQYKGREAQEFTPQEWRRRVHYVPQKPALFDGSVEDNMRMPFALSAVSKELFFNKPNALNYLEAMNLSPQILKQRASTLSGGEASRVALTRALLLEPHVLLLDEPTAALDETSSHSVMNCVGRWLQETNERAVIIVSHNRDDLSKLPNTRELMIPGADADSQNSEYLTIDKGENNGL